MNERAIPNYISVEYGKPKADQPITELDRVRIAYDDLGIDRLLLLYAQSGHYDTTLSEDIESVIEEYGQAVSTIAANPLGHQVAVVRAAFNRFYDGMDMVADAKHGPRLEKPTTMAGVLLTKLGIREPVYRSHFSRLGDQYWSKQFAEDYLKETFVKRVASEPEQKYVGRYIAACLRGFAWSHFSYI